MTTLVLAADLDELASLHAIESGRDARQKRAKVTHAIPHVRDEHDTDADLRQILLEPQGAICCEQHFEACIDGGAK